MKRSTISALFRTGYLYLSALLLLHNSDAATWSINLGSPIVASPLARDIDQDKDKEILISTLEGKVFLIDQSGDIIDGWPQLSGFLQRTSPNLGDIDGDGKLDVVIGDYSGRVHAWELDGSKKNGFPVQLEGTIQSTVRIIDFDQNGSCELLVHTGESYLYLLESNGKALPGWPIDLGGSPDRFGSWITASTPEVVDLDLDGQLEIVIGTTGNDIQVFNYNGEAIPGWPQKTGGWNYPSVAAVDINNDGAPELICPSEDGKLYAWSAKGEALKGFPITHSNPIIASVAVGEISNTDEGLELVVADLAGKVYTYTNKGKLLEGWPQSAKSGVTGSPLIVDINSDGQSEILVPSRDNRVHIWKANGETIESPILLAGDWIESTPVAEDIDEDGNLELLFASYDGLLRCNELGEMNHSPLQWRAFRNDTKSRADMPAFDSDRDLLPDQYEYEFLGNLTSSAQDDSDLDGSKNTDEWVAGTDPGSANDYFKAEISNVEIDNRIAQMIEWEAKAGRTYKIEYTEHLRPAETTWSLLDEVGMIDCQTDQRMCIEILPPIGQTQVFYRVCVERTE